MPSSHDPRNHITCLPCGVRFHSSCLLLVSCHQCNCGGGSLCNCSMKAQGNTLHVEKGKEGFIRYWPFNHCWFLKGAAIILLSIGIYLYCAMQSPFSAFVCDFLIWQNLFGQGKKDTAVWLYSQLGPIKWIPSIWTFENQCTMIKNQQCAPESFLSELF